MTSDKKPVKVKLEDRLLEYIKHDSSFFTLKELEGCAKKQFGAHGLQIKPALQALLDESLIRCEKIGLQNVYWSFASDTAHAKLRKRDLLQQRIESVTEENARLETSLAAESSARCDERRAEMLSTVATLRSKIAAIQKRAENAQLHVQRAELKRKLEQQTDNLCILVDLVVKCAANAGVSRQVVYSEFGICDADLESV